MYVRKPHPRNNVNNATELLGFNEQRHAYEAMVKAGMAKIILVS